MSRLPITFGLVIMSSVIGSVIAVIMGVAAALRKGRPSDAAISGLMLVLSGAPSFLVSILILIFMTKYVPGYSSEKISCRRKVFAAGCHMDSV